ncbi:hypothetical protein BJ138DRAFT_430857 [Hygrophoropsis aurantiaca]|uniref:Uncharacterized protein n=1 Tax=Hygrophoropsis aurantiaca TaxID=72124 RepID=A0ACB8A317_9AGAM|nr:hypothetical protein BJ138DRAFT_430857 [Hygrophoropsis aurantiaca]
MLLLMLAREAKVGLSSCSGTPAKRWTTIPHFLSHLFTSFDGLFSGVGRDCDGSTESPMGLHDVRVYFNHIIKMHQLSFFTPVRLAALFYRGAAVFCEPQPTRHQQDHPDLHRGGAQGGGYGCGPVAGHKRRDIHPPPRLRFSTAYTLARSVSSPMSPTRDAH